MGSESPRDQSLDLSGNENASKESSSCPQSENLNNVSSKEQFVTSKMSRNGKFIEDSSSGSIRPILDKHAPVRYGDPIINYDDSPDACFTVCSLDFYICENSSKNIQASNGIIGSSKVVRRACRSSRKQNLMATLTWTLNK